MSGEIRDSLEYWKQVEKSAYSTIVDDFSISYRWIRNRLFLRRRLFPGTISGIVKKIKDSKRTVKHDGFSCCEQTNYEKMGSVCRWRSGSCIKKIIPERKKLEEQNDVENCSQRRILENVHFLYKEFMQNLSEFLPKINSSVVFAYIRLQQFFLNNLQRNPLLIKKKKWNQFTE